ncbi:MAG: hypothetical protein QXP39_01910 [Candidatus Aenigmatarchaeota archaeon]
MKIVIIAHNEIRKEHPELKHYPDKLEKSFSVYADKNPFYDIEFIAYCYRDDKLEKLHSVCYTTNLKNLMNFCERSYIDDPSSITYCGLSEKEYLQIRDTLNRKKEKNYDQLHLSGFEKSLELCFSKNPKSFKYENRK